MAGNLFGGVRDITHYAADLVDSPSLDVPLGKTVRLNRAYVTGISVTGGYSNVQAGACGAYLVDAGDGTAQSILFVRYNQSGSVLLRASVVEYY